MKILNAEGLKRWDLETSNSMLGGGFALMEKACQAFCEEFQQHFSPTRTPVDIFCGKGNNGGDGYGIARILSFIGYQIKVYGIGDLADLSPDCQKNRQKLFHLGIEVTLLEESSPHPCPNSNSVIIEALFGYGLNRPLTGFALKLIEHLNSLPNPKVSVDVPAGMLLDYSNEDLTVFKSDMTVTFGCMKLPFILPDYGNLVGDVKIKDIGLCQKSLADIPCDNYLVDIQRIQELWKRRETFSHKYRYGHLCLIGGSLGKMGAVAMAGKGAFRTGVGLVTACVPQQCMILFQNLLHEAMCVEAKGDKYITKIPPLPAKINSVVLGPGLGIDSNQATATAVVEWLKLSETFCLMKVIDADAIRVIGQDKSLLPHLANNTVMTPHGGEFESLCGKSANYPEKLRKLRTFCRETNVVVVLKDSYTAIGDPNGNIWFIDGGTPALAKAGSGDVLSGMIGALLAQNYQPLHAAIVGAYLHTECGKLATNRYGHHSLLATELTDFIPDVIAKIEQANHH